MKKLRLSMVLLLSWMAIFFNVERLDLGEENIINIDTFVYILALVAVLLLISVPFLRRVNVTFSIIMWVIVYLICKQFFGSEMVGGVFTYLTITEVSLLVISVLLAHRLAVALQEFEEAVERITFADNSNKRIRPIEDAYDEIQIEMFRSRHHHHPLSIIVVKPELESIQTSLHRLVQEVQQSMMSSYVINNMAHTLGKYMRRTDFVLEQRDLSRFIILCPDTNAADLKLMVEYVQTVANEQLGTNIACGAATFPDEAITFEELLQKAESYLPVVSVNGRSGS